MRIGNMIRWIIAVGLVLLSFLNASWIAPQPAGTLQLIAARVGGGEDCPGLDQMRRALIDGGGPAVLPIQQGSECFAAATALRELPRYHFLFDTRDGNAALALFEAQDRPIDSRYGFFGSESAIAPIRAKRPDVWAFSVEQGRKCFSDYAWMGWLTIVPDSCAGGTMLVPLDQKWKIAGWPRRFQARLAASGTRIILTGPGQPAGMIPGLTRLDQIPEIPRDFTGLVWVDNIGLIGPSIRR
jgi:hypothetical protein